MRRTFLAAIAGLALAQIAPPTSRAQPPEQEKPTADDTADLQKATQNPVASLRQRTAPEQQQLWHRSF